MWCAIFLCMLSMPAALTGRSANISCACASSCASVCTDVHVCVCVMLSNAIALPYSHMQPKTNTYDFELISRDRSSNTSYRRKLRTVNFSYFYLLSIAALCMTIIASQSQMFDHAACKSEFQLQLELSGESLQAAGQGSPLGGWSRRSQRRQRSQALRQPRHVLWGGELTFLLKH